MSKPPVFLSLTDLFEFTCRRNPDALAYALVRDSLELESQLTYRQLERQVRSLAYRLAHEVKPGTRALLLYPPGLDVACAFWACVYAGLIPVPAPAPDPIRMKHSVPRLHNIIGDAQASLILTNSSIMALFSEYSLTKDVGPITLMATDHLIADATDSISIDMPRLDSSALAYLQYTSGSTASPRGVVISHGNVLAHCKALTLAGQVEDSSRSLCWLPYFHDYGLLHGIIAPFYAGIPAYLMSPITFLRRPLRWLDAVDRFAITHSGGPNFSYEACLRAVRQQKDWQADLSRWKVASCGAEPIHPDTVKRFIETFGPRGFKPASFSPAYGLAEATLLVTMKPVPVEPTFLTVDAEALADSIVKELPPSDRGTRTLVGCGEPLEDTCVKIVNPTTLLECPSGVVGEVWLSGAGVASGYWEKLDETKATFNATPAASGDGPYLRTGDLGFLHRGELFLTGRIKDLIIVRGRNYYPHDLEWTAQQAHPGLRRGCGAAFSIESETGEQVVLVHEIEKQMSDSDLTNIVNCIRRVLADEYELEIHTVVLVKSGTIPRTSSGKIQRGACRAAYESGQLTVVRTSTLDEGLQSETESAPEESPHTSVEKSLADIWQEVLGGSRPHRHANFFGLGGNSLLAAQVVARIFDLFHVEFPISILFESPTLSALAARVEEGRANPPDPGQVVGSGNRQQVPAVPLSSSSTRKGRIPLSPAQQRLWFLEQVHPGSAINHISMAVRIRGPVSPEGLERSVRAIASRHEILRTRFGSERGEGFSETCAEVTVTIERQDFQETDPTERDAHVRHFLRTDRTRPFDLRKGPLFRVTLLGLEPNVHILALTFHRLVAHGWSLLIFWKE